MMLPEISPSRNDVQQQIVSALSEEKVRLFVDANVLIRCYEMSRSACDELLSELERFGEKVRVPIWAAKETWDHTRALPSRQPLKQISAKVTQALGQFRSDSLRYVDARTFDDVSAEEFAADVDRLIAAAASLTRRTERLQPSHSDANARLLPFIANHSLSSNMPSIYEEVERTGEQRYAHEVPPGFKDGGLKIPTNGEESQGSPSQLKGKKRNRFGDLIMWLEMLQECNATDCEHLIVLTRDNSKGDWVYNPKLVLDDDGRTVNNAGLVTLPLPLLAQEARRRCPSLQSTHVISLEMFTQIVRASFGGRVSNLIRALQSESTPRRQARPTERTDRAADGEGAAATVSFGSGDMMYEPGDDTSSAIWRQIAGLRSEGWTAQNEAANALSELLPQADPDEAKQVGRGIVTATNEDALGPLELAEGVLANPEVDATVRANLLVGMLAETYFNEEGEPKKPRAHPEITASLFTHASDVETHRAYEVTVGAPLEPLRRAYFALPGEDERKLHVEVRTSGGSLQSVQVEDREVLEADAPASRQIVSGGRGSAISLDDLMKAVADAFVVPVEMLEIDGPTNYQVELPERLGFIDWGPETGEQLR